MQRAPYVKHGPKLFSSFEVISQNRRQTNTLPFKWLDHVNKVRVIFQASVFFAMISVLSIEYSVKKEKKIANKYFEFLISPIG